MRLETSVSWRGGAALLCLGLALALSYAEMQVQFRDATVGVVIGVLGWAAIILFFSWRGRRKKLLELEYLARKQAEYKRGGGEG